MGQVVSLIGGLIRLGIALAIAGELVNCTKVAMHLAGASQSQLVSLTAFNKKLNPPNR